MLAARNLQNGQGFQHEAQSAVTMISATDLRNINATAAN